ncbi:unnamed protein product [Auanema sp. JU1783]|nr:unnamed protein product [Auanema sp. JU1783]
MYRAFLVASALFLVAGTKEFKAISVMTPIHILFPLPESDDETGGKNPFRLSIDKVVPVVNLALEDAYKAQYIPDSSIAATFKSSKLSDAHGPNVAISQLVKNELDCIIGYAFVYALAPVARMTPTWTDSDSYGIPVITPIGLTMNLDDKKEYQLLTRISSPYKVVVSVVLKLFDEENWKKHVYLFHHIKEPSAPVGECFLLMASIQLKLKARMQTEHNFFTFNEHVEGSNRTMFKNILMKSSFIGNGALLFFSDLGCMQHWGEVSVFG